MSASPPFVIYKTEDEYKRHYKAQLCREKITTVDGIRVYFSEPRFWHAFSVSDTNGKKDNFCFERAKYIDWIRPALESADSSLWQGWNKIKQVYEPHRRVSVIFHGFIVIIELSLKLDGTLKATFITSYFDQRGSTVAKIIKAPPWKREECFQHLNKRGKK